MSNVTVCHAGHKKHDTKIVSTVQGDMQVYDWEKYMGYNGYCTGQDDVSRTLDHTGAWEPTESIEIKEVLENGDRSRLFIDVGAHVGWYSRMAEHLNYRVYAYEADKENCKLLEVITRAVDVENLWIDEDTTTLLFPLPIELLKIDIEGNERHAISLFKESLEAGSIANIYMEVSPVFNDSYPALIAIIESYGFKTYRHGSLFNHVYNFEQDNFLLKKEI